MWHLVFVRSNVPAQGRRAAGGGTVAYTREGNLLHPPGRGRAHRARGGVLPLRRLQPLVGPRGGSRRSGLPVLRHRLRRHRRPGRRPLRDRRGAGGRDRRCWQDAAAGEPGRPYVVFTGGEPLLQLDAAGRHGLPRSRLRGRGRDQRHDPATRRDRLAHGEPEARLHARGHARQRAEARLPARGGARGRRRRSTSSSSTCSRSTAPSWPRIPRERSTTAGATRAGG